jgi:HSP20 family protein
VTDDETTRPTPADFGRFHRAIRLPDRVDASGVKAVQRDGVLTVTAPKSEEAKPRRIAVQHG